MVPSDWSKIGQAFHLTGWFYSLVFCIPLFVWHCSPPGFIHPDRYICIIHQVSVDPSPSTSVASSQFKSTQTSWIKPSQQRTKHPVIVPLNLDATVSKGQSYHAFNRSVLLSGERLIFSSVELLSVPGKVRK